MNRLNMRNLKREIDFCQFFDGSPATIRLFVTRNELVFQDCFK
jgi:hypothetical protein